MTPTSAFETALKRIEVAHLATVGDDRIHLVYSSVGKLYDLDPLATERVLLEAARSAPQENRPNFIYAIMYVGGFKGDLSDDAFEFLLALGRGSDTDLETWEAAVGALSWSEFENASPQRLDIIQGFLQTIMSAPQYPLPPHTLSWVKATSRSIAERKRACEDLAMGRIVIPECVLQDLFAREGVDRFAEVGCGPSDTDKLKRLIAWTARTWLWPSLLERRTRGHDFYDLAVGLVSTTGRPVPDLSLIVSVDRRTGIKTLVACYVGMQGTRPDLLPSDPSSVRRWYYRITLWLARRGLWPSKDMRRRVNRSA